VTVFAFIACAFIWSTTWFVIRVCIGPGGYPTFGAAAIRFAIATAVLALLAALGVAGRGPRTWRQRGWIALAGLMCGLGYGLVYAAETGISGGLAAVIFGTLPLMTALVTSLTGTERPTRASIVGSVIGLVGILLIYRDRMTASTDQAVGVLLVFASVSVCAVYTVVLKRHTRDTDPLATNLWFLGACALALIPFAALYERQLPPWPPPLRPTVALLYLGVVGSVVVFPIYFFLIKRLTLMAASTLLFIEPVLALIIDAIWERQIRLSPTTYLGAAVTLVGVAVNLLLRPRPQPVPVAPPAAGV
jgi:drug/metabolite transporter (DMT)-like permease